MHQKETRVLGQYDFPQKITDPKPILRLQRTEDDLVAPDQASRDAIRFGPNTRVKSSQTY